HRRYMENIVKKIDLLEECVKEHYRRLNAESTWLFVAIIGCWSISVSWVQLLAVGFIFYFLFRNVFDGLSLKSSYGKELKSIRTEISSLGADDETEDRLYGKVWKIENKYLTVLATFKHNTKFLVAMFFCGISLFYFWG
ncbi:hypothetical protein ACOIWI_004448, partial [Vibrio vulnificus]